MSLEAHGPPWLARAERSLRPWRGAGVVVAVSGGGDSVGLLRVLHSFGPRLELRLSVAHLNHNLRGAESDADAAFVADLAGSLGLPFDLGHWAPVRSHHVEADARRARYDWLAAVAGRRGAAAVAVGHNRDDQAETILHRILRGTGPRGLAGMPARRPLAEGMTLIRPLLHATRGEVRDHLSALGQPFRDDATNADTSRTRARLRHDLLPKLAGEYNPRVAEALVRLGQLAGASERALCRAREAALEAAWIAAEPPAILLRRSSLRGLPRSERAAVLRLAWRRAGWPEGGMTAARWLRLAGQVKRGPSRASVGGGIELRVSEDFVRLEPIRRDAAIEGPPARLALPGSAAWGGGRIVATPEPGDEGIDLDALRPFRDAAGEPALEIRSPRPGDRFEPLGLEGRGMPLADFLRGRRVPKEGRASVPILWDRAGIVWVVGHRIAHRVRRVETTRRVLGLRWEPGCG